MKVFVTGASGYIGNATACAFRRAGHDVYGLVRSDKSAEMLRSQEIVPLVGDIGDLKKHKEKLEQMHVYVNCAFESTQEGVAKDRSAVDFFCDLGRSAHYPKSFLYTSGVWVYGSSDHVVNESTHCQPISLVSWRLGHEEKVLNATTNLFKTVVIRPGVVFGGSGGLTQLWFEGSGSGVIDIAGEGLNYWPMIHRDDLAWLYVKACEHECKGIVLNATDGSYHKVKHMAQAIANACEKTATIRKLSHKEAQEKYGPLSEGLMVNQLVSSDRARNLLGWQPRHLPFILEVDKYLKAWKKC